MMRNGSFVLLQVLLFMILGVFIIWSSVWLFQLIWESDMRGNEGDGESSFAFEDFGKTVFLTREEAEQAPKGEHHAEIH